MGVDGWCRDPGQKIVRPAGCQYQEHRFKGASKYVHQCAGSITWHPVSSGDKVINFYSHAASTDVFLITRAI